MEITWIPDDNIGLQQLSQTGVHFSFGLVNTFFYCVSHFKAEFSLQPKVLTGYNFFFKYEFCDLIYQALSNLFCIFGFRHS